MATQLATNDRSGAEVYHGAEICYQKSLELLEELGLPKGLLPLKELEESGYVRETGFVWLKQKKPCQHRNKKIGRVVLYGTEITAYVEKYKMKKMTGVKSKELLLWVPITEMSVEGPDSDKIYFKSSVGIGKSFPVKAFELDDDNDDEGH